MERVLGAAPRRRDRRRAAKRATSPPPSSASSRARDGRGIEDVGAGAAAADPGLSGGRSLPPDPRGLPARRGDARAHGVGVSRRPPAASPRPRAPTSAPVACATTWRPPSSRACCCSSPSACARPPTCASPSTSPRPATRCCGCCGRTGADALLEVRRFALGWSPVLGSRGAGRPPRDGSAAWARGEVCAGCAASALFPLRAPRPPLHARSCWPTEGEPSRSRRNGRPFVGERGWVGRGSFGPSRRRGISPLRDAGCAATNPGSPACQDREAVAACAVGARLGNACSPQGRRGSAVDRSAKPSLAARGGRVVYSPTSTPRQKAT